MKKSNLAGGCILILFAAYLILNKLGMLPDIAWFKLLVTILMGYLVVKNVPKVNFFGIIMPLCVIGCMYDKQLGIEAITPWTLLLSGLLLSGGLAMIFKKKPVFEINIKRNGNMSDRTENWEDGRVIHLENNFNSVSKYVNTDAFSEAYIENNFGSCNVYFNNAIMANGSTKAVLENNFGEMNIYFPKTWRMELDRDVSFGNVKVYGEGNADMDAPCIFVNAECNFGSMNIYFE